MKIKLTNPKSEFQNPNSRPACPVAQPAKFDPSSFAIRHSSFRRQRAFTLIELLLVLVILGILAAIVVPKFAGRTEQARLTAAQTDISSMDTALSAYEVDNGGYPKGKSGLLDLVQQPREAQNWKGPYIKDVPKDPWRNDYIYEYPGRHNANSYDLSSPGPDGKPGSDDDVTNWKK